MKKYIFLFLLIIPIISCSSGKKDLVDTSCPNIFISKEHKNFYSIVNATSDDFAYIATINNFEMKCETTDRQAIRAMFDILFIVTPLNDELKVIDFSYFVSILNNDKEVIDTQLFRVQETFSLDEKWNSKETTIVESLIQYLPTASSNYEVSIGFVLTEDQYKFINE